MNKLALLSATALFASPLAAQDADPAAAAAAVSQQRLRADVETLVGFGTRHTLSEQNDPERGIGAAVDWGLAEFGRISAGCNGCLTIVAPERMVEGPRIPQPTRLRNAVAIQLGSERPNEVVIVQGHIDSRVSDVSDWRSDAPGANDDASGTALVLEAARNLSQRRYPVTIVYALLSGEEQGLFGGRLLADYAGEQGWDVKAVLNNDIVGGSCGSDGVCDDAHVRVFSEGPRADLTAALRAGQRREGGENDSPSRNLSRFIDSLADEARKDDAEALDVRQIWRTDRMGRGGDQIPFLEKGYPAVRFSVAIEDYEHQHQDLRTDGGTTYGDTVDEMDFPYLAKVTQLNILTLDALARSPAPPVVTAEAAVRTDTLLEWTGSEGASGYEIKGRRTDEADWSTDFGIVDHETPVTGLATTLGSERAHSFIVPVRGDDWIFGVCAFGSSGAGAGRACSPFASAVPAGQFAPVGPTEGETE